MQMPLSPGARYLVGLGCYLTLGFLTILAVCMLFVSRSGEVTDVTTSVHMQAENDQLLYGPALLPTNFRYKLALYAQRHPEVVAIGSSRVLQFRQSFFNLPFANVGGNMNNPREGLQLLNGILAQHRPRLAIINLDFWWFNASAPYALTFPSHAFDGTALRLEDYAVLARWLLTGRFSPSEIVETMLQRRNETSPFPNGLGIRARFIGQGFASDGAEYDFGLIAGQRSPDDRRFAQSLSRVRSPQGYGEFLHGEAFSEFAWADLVSLIERLKADQISTVVFIPPVARTVRQAIDGVTNQYVHLTTLRERIKTLSVPAFDFSDLNAIGGNDCEFIDATHPGEIGVMRMLLAMRPHLPPEWVQAINWQRVVQTVARFPNRTVSSNDFGDFAQTEADFLDINCQKGK